MVSRKKLEGLHGPRVLGVRIGEWCQTQDGTGPVTAVALTVTIASDNGPIDVVCRIKSRRGVENVIKALNASADGVWPKGTK